MKNNVLRYLLLMLLIGFLLSATSACQFFAQEPNTVIVGQALMQEPASTPKPALMPEPTPIPKPTPEPTPKPTPKTERIKARLTSTTVTVNGVHTYFVIYEIEEQLFVDLFEVASALFGTEMQFYPIWSDNNETVYIEIIEFDETDDADEFGDADETDDVDGVIEDGEANEGIAAIEMGKANRANHLQSALVFSTVTPVDINAFLDEREVSIPAYNIAGDIFLDFVELAALLDLIVYTDPSENTIDVYTNRTIANSFIRKKRIDPSLPMVALTFDDGPHNLTIQVLDILEKHDAVATFYVIGMQIERHRETVLRAFNMGNEIANHTWTHPALDAISTNHVRTQLQDTSDAIEAVTGVRPTQMRPPYGRHNFNVQNIAKELDLAIITWTVDPTDYLPRSPEDIYDDIMNAVRDKDIILLHDIHERTIEATRDLVPSLIKRGFQLVTVSELMYFSDITLEPGKIYRHGRG